MMRRDRGSLVLPSEARLIPMQDHVHHIYISNDEKHMTLVTNEAFIVSPVMPSLKPDEPKEIRVNFPQDEMTESQESRDSVTPEDKEHDGQEVDNEEEEEEDEEKAPIKDQTLKVKIVGALSDTPLRLFFQMVKPGSNFYTRDCAYVANIVMEKIDFVENEVEHTTYNYFYNINRVKLPPTLASEEIISIRFVEASSDFL